MEDDDSERASRRIGEPACGVLQLRGSDPRPDWWSQGRTEFRPTTWTRSERNVGSVVSQRRSNWSNVRVKRAIGVYGMSWFPGTADQAPEALEEVRRPVVLVRTASVRQVAARDDQLGIDPLDQVDETSSIRGSSRVPTCRSESEEHVSGGGHSRGRLSSRCRPGRAIPQSVVDEPTEIFDDLYAEAPRGGALRKKRRGEPLTSEEEEALGRWQRLARVRKAVALGAFTLGTARARLHDRRSHLRPLA